MEKDNIILVKGWPYNKTKQVLNQWLSLYYEKLDDDFSFELYNIGNEECVIFITGSLDNIKFNYLVNYLTYPVGFEYKVNVEGFTTATDSKIYPKEFLYKKLLVYILETDNEGDNVFVVTSDNENLKVSFRGKVKNVDSYRYYKYPDFEFGKLENPEIISLNKKKVFIENGLANKFEVKRSFIVVSFIFVTLFPISFLFILKQQTFLLINSWLSFMVMFWYAKDYKMLQIDEYYLYSLLFSLLILIYGLILQTRIFPSRGRDLLDMSTKLPVIFLILQYPTRYLFKTIVKREPIVKRPVKTVEDIIYIGFLILVAFLIAFIISSMKIN